jgi:hypothetical protein
MELQSSGQISFEDIADELGDNPNAQSDMDDMTSQAVGDSGITNEPDNIDEWYSYNHFGRGFGQDDGNTETFLKRVSQGGTETIGAAQAEAEEFEADRNESTRVDKTAGGAPFVGGDNEGADLFRRDKNTGGSWGSAIQSWATGNYTSQSVSCDFDTYDYKWVMSDIT